MPFDPVLSLLPWLPVVPPLPLLLPKSSSTPLLLSEPLSPPLPWLPFEEPWPAVAALPAAFSGEDRAAPAPIARTTVAMIAMTTASALPRERGDDCRGARCFMGSYRVNFCGNAVLTLLFRVHAPVNSDLSDRTFFTIECEQRHTRRSLLYWYR
ncbi:hypothetical protein [Gordonia rhizosphera]|uniref:hypothetical protein n=1 Tax=Gordonia rhizosphera TaxID=83341 RepID=UPI0012F65C54|nr:hypothetical protein [Gordonia rhizosphera]